MCQPLLGALRLGVLQLPAGPVHVMMQACFSVPGVRLSTKSCVGPRFERVSKSSLPACCCVCAPLSLQVRPTLLNSQDWLRFWVEEHLVLPNSSGTAAAKRGRRTISLNSRSNSSNSGEAPGEGAGAEGGAGRQALAAVAGSGAAGSGSQAHVKAIRWATTRLGMLSASFAGLRYGPYGDGQTRCRRMSS